MPNQIKVIPMDISSTIQVGMNDNDVSRKSTSTITKARKSEQSVPSSAIKFKFKENKNFADKKIGLQVHNSKHVSNLLITRCYVVEVGNVVT